MFGRNSQKTHESVAKKGIKGIDAVVTGVLLGGLIASIYGVRKLRDKDKIHEEVTETSTHHMPEIPKTIEKVSLWKRIFRIR